MNFDLLKSFEQALTDPKTWPTLEDLRTSRVFRDEATINLAKALIARHRVCVIRGAEGRGKTVLCRLTANEFKNHGWKICMLDAPSVQSALDARAIASDMDPRRYGSDTTLLVVENAHAGIDGLVEELLALINSPGISLLFTTRKVFSEHEDTITGDPFETVVGVGCSIDLAPTVDTVEAIIKTTLASRRRLDYALDAKDRAWIVREFRNEMPNLRRLKWYLEYWLNSHHGRLATVTRDKVYGEVWSFFMSPLSSGSVGLSRGPLEPLQEMLLRIAAVYQFDVPFDGKGEDPVALRRLLKERLISVVGGTGEYRMQHSSDARFLVESEAATRRKSPEEVTVKCLQYYLERGAASYYQLLVALRRTGETLSACLAAPLKTDELVATAARGELGEIANLVDCMVRVGRKPAADQLWEAYKRQLGVNPEDTANALKRKFQAASLQHAGYAMRMMRELSPDEWEQAVGPSGVCSVEMLTAKIHGQSFGPVWGLMKSLPDEARNLLLKNLDFAELRTEFAVDPATRTPFTRLVALATELPTERVHELLGCFEPGKLARQMAKASHIMDCNFLLNQCRRAAVDGSADDRAAARDFGISFISALHKESTFLDELRDSDIGTVSSHLLVVGKFSPALRNTVEKSLGPDSWAKILLSSNLHAIEKYMFHVASTPQNVRSSNVEETCRTVLHALAQGALKCKGRELYERAGGIGERKPLEVLGRLLSAIARLRRTIDVQDEDVRGIVKQIPDLTDCSPSWCDSEQLSLLLSNLQALEADSPDSVTHNGKDHSTAALAAVARKACTYEWKREISPKLKTGVAELMYFLGPVEPQVSKRIADSVFALDVGSVLDDLEPEAIAKFIWRLTHVNRAGTGKWVRGVPSTRWVDAVGLM